MEHRTPQRNENNSDFYDIDDQINKSGSRESHTSSKTISKENESQLTGEVADLKEIIDHLQQKLEEQEIVNQKSKDRYLRALADYENLEKRTKVERARLIKNANTNLIVKLLDFADTLEKAKSSILETKNEQSVLTEGFLALEKQFFTILKNEGVEKLESLGKKFDPAFHEAVFVRKDSGEGEDIILEEVQAGYLLNSTLLRPSKVIIAK